MYFALFYILFFAIDILIVFRFETLGMLPANYLVAGVGTFCIFNLVKRFSFIPERVRDSYVSKLFIFHLFTMTCINLAIGFLVIIQSILSHITTSSFIVSIQWIAFFTSLAVNLFITFNIKLKGSIFFWMFFSVTVSTFRWGIVAIPPEVHALIHRFSGVVDLIMIFGWLMIIVQILKREFDPAIISKHSLSC